MRRRVQGAVCLAICLALGGIVVSGCNSGENKASAQEQADFKGKPMPADVQKYMQTHGPGSRPPGGTQGQPGGAPSGR